MSYKNIKMYDIIKEEMVRVIDAEENSKAWKMEARTRMKDVGALITAAKKVNKDVEINPAELVAEIRLDLTSEAEENGTYEGEDETVAPNDGEEAVSEG